MRNACRNIHPDASFRRTRMHPFLASAAPRIRSGVQPPCIQTSRSRACSVSHVVRSSPQPLGPFATHRRSGVRVRTTCRRSLRSRDAHSCISAISQPKTAITTPFQAIELPRCPNRGASSWRGTRAGVLSLAPATRVTDADDVFACVSASPRKDSRSCNIGGFSVHASDMSEHSTCPAAGRRGRTPSGEPGECAQKGLNVICGV